MNNRYLELIRDYLDERISAEDLAELNQLLEADADVRAQFRLMATVEEGLHDLAAIPEPSLGQPAPVRWPYAAWAALAVAACAVFVIALAVARRFGDAPATIPEIAYASPEIACVDNLDGSASFEGATLRKGEGVSEGVLRCESGSIDLRFCNGTQLLIEGPSELSIDTEMQVTLKRGRVAARVSEASHGFTVRGPDSAVVDLGTEFGMVVDAGKSWVEVYEGEVDIALLNKNGHAWKSRQLTASGPVRIDAAKGLIVDEAPQIAMPRFPEFSLEGLDVPKAYVEAVLKKEPAHYWRFEEAQDGRSEDSAGDAISALEGGARIHDGCLYLPPGLTDRPRDQQNHGFVSIDKPSQSLAKGELSMEAWVKPAFFQRRSLIDIRHRNPESSLRSILYSLVLVPSQQQTVFPRETFRFATHLWPYGESGELGVFSADRYVPNSWHHVVAVRHREKIEIYLDGRSVQSVPAPSVTANSQPTMILIGHSPRPQRQAGNRGFFKGLIDEVAIYPFAMPAEQVVEHYQLMQER